MKVTVTHAGTEIMVDDDDVKAIAEFVLALDKRTNGHTAPAKPKRKKKARKPTFTLGEARPAFEPPPEAEPEPVSISPQLYDTWQDLINNGSSSGSHVNEVARDLNIKPVTAQYRLTQLVKLGLAHKVSPGMYQPGEMPT